MHPKATVIIPTHGRADKLARCLDALAAQSLPDGQTIEVVVAIDGDESSTYTRIHHPENVRLLSLPRCGIAAARNAAIEAARGDILLFTNDDCYPAADWAAVHLAAQSRRSGGGMVVGRTNWMAWDDPTVFDGLVRDTSMIFFYDQMQTDQTYGFRHFWTCNASVPAAPARQAGGFDERIRPYGFEDLEFAFRLERAGFRGVAYRPDAVNVHDHRLEWGDYCNREACLGRMAACLAEMNPDCFAELYGQLAPAAMRDRFEAWLANDAGDHASSETLLRQWMDRPLAEAADWPAVRELLYALHLPVKRRLFREAYVEHFELRHDAQWRERMELGHSFP